MRSALLPTLRAEKNAGLTSIAWKSDDVVTLGTINGNMKDVHIAELNLASHESVHAVLRWFTEVMFSDGFVHDHLAQISLSAFDSHESSPSIFSSPASTSLISILLAKLPKTKISLAKAREHLANGQKFLELFVLAFYRTSLMPPPPWKVVEFTYSTDLIRDIPRNFVLLNGTHGAFVKARSFWGRDLPKASKVHRTHNDESVWPLPPSLSWLLVMYLAVFRPGIELPAFKKVFPEQDHRDLNTFIFIRRSKAMVDVPHVWTPDYLKSILKDGLKMSTVMFREVMDLVNDRRYAPVLKYINEPSALDRQGQHSGQTAQSHYAIQSIRYSTGAHFSALDKQILITQLLHADCFLAQPPILPSSIELEPDTYLTGNIDVMILLNHRSALMKAKSLVFDDVVPIDRSVCSSGILERCENDPTLLYEVMIELESGCCQNGSDISPENLLKISTAAAAMVS